MISFSAFVFSTLIALILPTKALLVNTSLLLGSVCRFSHRNSGSSSIKDAMEPDEQDAVKQG